MNLGPIQIAYRERGRAARLKEAVLASFYEPAPSIAARLREFTARDWQRSKYWLDVSGLALYFLRQLETLKLQPSVPEPFLLQLRTNLAENKERTTSLLNEAITITGAIRKRNIECAVLKGFTIPLESVHDFSLRSQMDLDLLIREPDAKQVGCCLSEFGYSLSAISGSTWEFKAGPSGTSSLKNLYQVRPERAIEVHLLRDQTPYSKSDRLARSGWRLIDGRPLPSLSPADLFVMQGCHLFKHMCGEYTRASWVLEYWRHVCARRDDAGFWREVECIAADEPGAVVAIGAATLLTSVVLGQFAPRELARWSMNQLPPGVCLWIHLYGRRILLSDRPGSKLYLLLRKELNPSSAIEKAARRRLLFPIRMPQNITTAGENEALLTTGRRYLLQARFALRRFRFHLLEGLGLAFESLRWQRRNGGISQ
jgi:hypothetical protein